MRRRRHHHNLPLFLQAIAVVRCDSQTQLHTLLRNSVASCSRIEHDGRYQLLNSMIQRLRTAGFVCSRSKPLPRSWRCGLHVCKKSSFPSWQAFESIQRPTARRGTKLLRHASPTILRSDGEEGCLFWYLIPWHTSNIRPALCRRMSVSVARLPAADICFMHHLLQLAQSDRLCRALAHLVRKSECLQRWGSPANSALKNDLRRPFDRPPVWPSTHERRA